MPRRQARYGRSAYRTSKTFSVVVPGHMPISDSGVSHLDEIKNADLPMPAVNQIEVRFRHVHGRRDRDVLLQLHPLCQQRSIVEYCGAKSIVVQAYSPIIKGRMDHEAIWAVANKVHLQHFTQPLSIE